MAVQTKAADQSQLIAKVVNRKIPPLKRIRKNWQLWVIILLPFLYIIIFRYGPMYGAQIAFKDFIITKGILGSPWVGFANFARFFKSYWAERIILNTVVLSLYSLLAGFPLPIILAISLNEVRNRMFKKSVQMVTYMPYFISTVVMVSLILQVLNPRMGVITIILRAIGFEATNILGKAEAFKTIYVLSHLWQQTGYSSIIYLAALSAIDPQLHEAAIVDGASRLQRIFRIDIPGIMPTAIILLILNTGQIMNIAFEKVYLLQNALNLRSSEVIATYVYKVGLLNADFAFSTAVNLFNSVINLTLLLIVNWLARRFSETSLW